MQNASRAQSDASTRLLLGRFRHPRDAWRHVVLTLVMTGALLSAALTLVPGGAHADRRQTPAINSDTLRARAATRQALSALIGSSRQVLAVHPARLTPHTDILLWMHDDDGSETISPDELVMVTHSNILRSIAVYRMQASSTSVRPVSDISVGRGVDSVAEAGVVADVSALSAGDLVSRAFCDRWRSSVHVRDHILAISISDVSVETMTGTDENGPGLRIGLIWGGDSADSNSRTIVTIPCDVSLLQVKEPAQ